MLSLFRILATAIWGVSRGEKTDFVQAPYIPSNGASHATSDVVLLTPCLTPRRQLRPGLSVTVLG